MPSVTPREQDRLVQGVVLPPCTSPGCVAQRVAVDDLDQHGAGRWRKGEETVEGILELGRGWSQRWVDEE